MADNDTNLEDFLQKVNEIEGLVKNLASAEDDQAHKNALQEADKFLGSLEPVKQSVQIKQKYPPRDNTGVNRTVINHAAFKGDCDVAHGPQLDNQMSQEAFMSVIEQDAKARAARKAQRHKEATAIKDLGNQQFKAGNFQAALDKYSEALTIMKDYPALWTNRAQCYIKLEHYEKAIEDCDWALRITEKCLKAYIHKGKALAALGRFDEALSSFQTAIEVEPKKKKVPTGYISDVKLQQKSREEEKQAQEALDAGSMESLGVVGILEKLQAKGQLAYYYSGALRLLQHAMVTNNERTLFRTNGGLKLTETHHYISKCFAASPRSLSKEEVDLCAATMETYEAASIDNEENARMLLSLPDLPEQILRLLESKWKNTSCVKLAIIKTLHVWSQSDMLRARLVTMYSMARLLPCLFDLMRSKKQSTASTAVSLLNNLALDKQFKSQLQEKLVDVLPAFEALMNERSSSVTVLPSCVSTVTNLCGDSVLRQQLQERTETWQACCGALDHYTTSPHYHDDIVYSLLGLINNLSLNVSNNLQAFSTPMCEKCCRLITLGNGEISHKVLTRACTVIGQVLPHSDEAVNQTCRSGVLAILLQLLQDAKDDAILKAALKIITVCTQTQNTARQLVCDSKALPTLVALLKHSLEPVVGNAALCLSHCTTIPVATEMLTHTNIVMDTLVLARDAQNKTARQNCSILIAKLALSHNKHLERLRELDGLGILHDAMKSVKL